MAIEVTTVSARLLDVKAAAAYLSSTTWAVRKMVWSKELPEIRIGQRLLFDIKDLDKLIERAKATGARYGSKQ